MLARRSIARRPLSIAFFALVCLYIIFAFGPPIFTPSTTSKARGKATEWKHLLENDISAIYQTSTSADDNPKIRQATMLFEGDKDHLRNMYDRSVATHLKHGERWGMPTHVLRTNLVEEGSYFNKPAWLLNLVMTEMAKPKNSRAEWIVWFDADSIIMNPEIPWSLFLPPSDFSDKHILATTDTNGFNAGMLLLRVHTFTISLLTLALALPALSPTTKLPFHDQSALLNICARDGYAEHFLYQPRRWWNRYHHDANGEEKGAMGIHFAGVSSVGQGADTKREVMTRFLERVELRPEEWSVGVKETGYPGEVEAYWERLRRSRRLLERAGEVQEKGKVGGKAKEEVLELRRAGVVDVVLRWAHDEGKVEEANKKLEGVLPAEKKS